jgi:hypothetical protein
MLQLVLHLAEYSYNAAGIFSRQTFKVERILWIKLTR